MMIGILPLAWLAETKVLGFILIFSFIYTWSRYEPEVLVNFFWGFQVKAVHFPFVLIGLSFLFKMPILTCLIGLVVGEAFYWLKESAPQDYGYDLLSTPGFFEKLINYLYTVRANQGNRPNPGNPNIGPNVRFIGRGHRLG